MRILIVALVLGLALAGVPTAAAEEPSSGTSTSAPTTTPTTTSGGPEPSSCRPYCFNN